MHGRYKTRNNENKKNPSGKRNEDEAGDYAKNNRKRAGAWLKEQRQKAGLSQKDLADMLGFKYYTFVSQVENGFGKVPSESMADWARCLGVPPASFARTLLAYYDPALHQVLFEDELP